MKILDLPHRIYSDSEIKLLDPHELSTDRATNLFATLLNMLANKCNKNEREKIITIFKAEFDVLTRKDVKEIKLVSNLNPVDNNISVNVGYGCTVSFKPTDKLPEYDLDRIIKLYGDNAVYGQINVELPNDIKAQLDNHRKLLQKKKKLKRRKKRKSGKLKKQKNFWNQLSNIR